MHMPSQSIFNIPTDRPTIFAQQQAALEVLDRLSALDSEVKLLGGAPRNWYFNRPARDMDIYFKQWWGKQDPQSVYSVAASLSIMFGTEVKLKGLDPSGDNGYMCISCIGSVFSLKYNGFEFDLIGTIPQKDKTAYVEALESFDSSISKLQWDVPRPTKYGMNTGSFLKNYAEDRDERIRQSAVLFSYEEDRKMYEMHNTILIDENIKRPRMEKLRTLFPDCVFQHYKGDKPTLLQRTVVQAAQPMNITRHKIKPGSILFNV